MEKKRVLIVGAGLAGLALYRTLDKQEFDVEIVERRKNFENLGYAVIFMPNGVRALRKLGFPKQKVNRLGRPIREFVVYDDKNEITHQAKLDKIWEKYDRYLVVERKELHSLLESGIDKKNIRFSTELSSFKQDSGGVRARFKGDRRTHKYDVIIGADGANSFVRKTLFPHARVTSLGALVIWSWLPRKTTAIGKRTVAFIANKRGIGYFDTGDSEKMCAFTWTEQKALPAKITPRLYPLLWRDSVAPFNLVPIKGVRSTPAATRMYAHEDRSVDLRSWKKGNVVLIGDAAHTRGVFTGSGTALAIEDGYLLGNYLNTEKSVSEGLSRFCAVQQPRVHKMVPTLVGPKFLALLEEFLGSSRLFSK
jgi:salicylate hydroxylase